MLYRVTRDEQTHLMDRWCEATTSGVWATGERDDAGTVLVEDRDRWRPIGKFERSEDARFAAEAWNWMSQLLCYVEELEANLAVAERRLDSYQELVRRLSPTLPEWMSGGAPSEKDK